VAGGARPAVRYTADIDDWLAVIAAGGVVGVTPESTVAQYPRPGIVFRPVRDVPPVPVRVAWWRDDPHPAARGRRQPADSSARLTALRCPSGN
jgi:DNA-binding transcriptional LysR family regulator